MMTKNTTLPPLEDDFSKRWSYEKLPRADKILLIFYKGEGETVGAFSLTPEEADEWTTQLNKMGLPLRS